MREPYKCRWWDNWGTLIFSVVLDLQYLLRELEIPREDRWDIAEETMVDGAGRNNPVPINSVQQVLEVLEKAW